MQATWGGAGARGGAREPRVPHHAGQFQVCVACSPVRLGLRAVSVVIDGDRGLVEYSGIPQTAFGRSDNVGRDIMLSNRRSGEQPRVPVKVLLGNREPVRVNSYLA